MVINRKTEELLVRQLKTCEKNMQEFNDSIKRSSLKIMGIEDGEEVQEKGMHNIQQNNNRNLPKSRKNYTYTSTGRLQNSKQT
jgi:hypothetical protein